MPTFKEKWKHAKEVFQATAKVKKPSAKVDSFFRKPAGIDSALEKVDAAEPKMNLNKAGLDAFVATAAGFKTAKDAYLRVLDATVGAEPTGTDKVAYQKGVVVLKTQLVAMESSMKALSAASKAKFDGATGLGIMAGSFIETTESAVHNAQAFIARAKATPTPVYFNTNIVKAARDITQQIGNVDKLKAKGFHFRHEQPTNLFKVIKAWANDGRTVPTTATTAEVLREINAVEQAVAGVDRWLKGEEHPTV
jgi:hypothetical protein